MVAYIKPQQRKKEESKWPRGEKDQIKFIDQPYLFVSVFYQNVLFSYPLGCKLFIRLKKQALID